MLASVDIIFVDTIFVDVIFVDIIFVPLKFVCTKLIEVTFTAVTVPPTNKLFEIFILPKDANPATLIFSLTFNPPFTTRAPDDKFVEEKEDVFKIITG